MTIGLRALLLAAAMSVVTCVSLYSQDTRGMIFGRVVDPQSSPIVSAHVVITNTNTGVSTERRTNATGYYEANLLIAGTYRVTAEVDGFKRFTRNGIELQLGERLQIEIPMEIGSMVESVTVNEEAPLIETNNVSSGRVIDNRSVNELPVARNNPVLLAAFSPGIQVRGGYRTNAHRAASIVTAVFFSPGNVGGRSFTDSSNDYLIDGMPNVGNNRRIAFLPHTDAVQELKVETSNLNPAVGHSSGVSLSLLTKSGTNEAHGALTWQHMQQRWNAVPFFIKQAYYRNIAQLEAAGDSAGANALRNENPQQPGRSNDYSASLGGPVFIPKFYDGRNKLFFFVNFNGTNERLTETTSSINSTVPTMLNRDGNFTDLLGVDPVRYQIYDPLTARADPNRPSNIVRTPFAGNLIPKGRWINPGIGLYNSIFPTPNNPPALATSEPLNNYVASGMPWQFDYYSFSNRVDYQHSDKHRFFGRWNWSDFKENRSDWTYETATGLQSSDLQRANKGAMVDWVYVPTATTFFDFAVSANQFVEGVLGATTKTYSPSDAGLPSYVDQKAADEAHLPVMNLSGYRELSRNYSTQLRATIYAAKADVSHVTQNHTFTGGFGVRQYFRTGGGGGNTGGRFTFDNSFTSKHDDGLVPAGSLGHSYAAFLLGLPNSMSIASSDNFAAHTPAYSWHFQDNWRVNSRLTVILGLRAEYEQGMTERYDRMLGGFDRSLTLPITQGAEAAYAANPLAELRPQNFDVVGGTLYAGQGKHGRNIWQNELLWLPRLGAALQLDSKTVLRGGYGVFYDSLNALYLTPNQFGYSRNTSTNVTNDFGQTWLVGDPANGVSPLSDPFPVRADGSRFDQPVRNSLGSMAYAGNSFSFQDEDIRRARNQRWRVGVQRQLTSSTVVEAAYAGTYADRVYVSHPENILPGQYWATGNQRNNAVANDLNQNVANPFHISNFQDLQTSNPAAYQQISTLGFFTSPIVRKHQLLRAFPQMSGLTNSADSVGNVWTQSIELTFRQRLSRGIILNANYTGLSADSADIFENEYDAEPTRRTSAYGAPHRFNATGIFELPFGRGRRFVNDGWVSTILGGWQMGLTFEYQTGLPLDFPNSFYYGDLDNIAKSSDKTLDSWFNTADFERTANRTPAAFHSRVFPTRVDGVRGQSMNEWNGNVQRDFSLGEQVRLQFRLDAINLMNRSIFGQPNTTPTSSDFGRITSTTEMPNRFLQFQLRLRF